MHGPEPFRQFTVFGAAGPFSGSLLVSVKGVGSEEIEDKPFNEGTLTKHQLFEPHAQAWLPVFTAPPDGE